MSDLKRQRDLSPGSRGRGVRPKVQGSPAADERYDLEDIAVLDVHPRSFIPSDDPAVPLDRHAVKREIQLQEQLGDRSTFRALRRNPVHRDRETGQGNQRAGDAAAREAR